MPSPGLQYSFSGTGDIAALMVEKDPKLINTTIKLSSDISASIHHTDNVNGLLCPVRNIEYQIVIYRHDAKVSGTPRFIYTKSLWHLGEA